LSPYRQEMRESQFDELYGLRKEDVSVPFVLSLPPPKVLKVRFIDIKICVSCNFYFDLFFTQPMTLRFY
jgi:hypothetical protein